MSHRLTDKEDILELIESVPELSDMPGLFDAKSTVELQEMRIGAFQVRYAFRGQAAIFQYLGPFAPNAEQDICLCAESGGVPYFADWTPETWSWFLAFDYRLKPLATEANLARVAQVTGARLSVSYQEYNQGARAAP
jgi:hypothetical protein